MLKLESVKAAHMAALDQLSKEKVRSLPPITTFATHEQHCTIRTVCVDLRIDMSGATVLVSC